MSIKHFVTMVITLAVGVPVIASSPQDQKAATRTVSPGLKRMPPSTLSQMLSKVDLVVHVRIVSSEPKVRQIPGGSESLIVATAQIIERGRTRLPFVLTRVPIRIVQRVEQLEGESRMSEEMPSPLQVASSYILALDRDESQGAYYLAFGSEGVFEVENGEVHPRGKSRAAQELADKRLAEAIQRIK